MTEEKMRRLIAAATSMAVIVLFILVSVMAVQLISLSAKKKEIDRLKAEIAVLQQNIDSEQDEIDLWLQEWKIEERARQLGMVNGKD